MDGKPFRKIQGKYELDEFGEEMMEFAEGMDELAESLDEEALWQKVQMTVMEEVSGKLKAKPSDICLKDILDNYDKDTQVKRQILRWFRTEDGHIDR